MGNVRFGFEDCARIQAHIRRQYDSEGPTVMAAYLAAERQLEAERVAAQPDSIVGISGTYVNCNNELKHIKHSTPQEHSGKLPVFITDALPGLGGRDVVEHREKRHVFADGTEWRCCAATLCMWGRPVGNKLRKKHNDGTVGGTIYSADVVDAEPDEQDVVEELAVPTFGRDTGECEDEVDERTDEEVEEDEGEDEDEDSNLVGRSSAA
jgi:hypothetical protein